MRLDCRRTKFTTQEIWRETVKHEEGIVRIILQAFSCRSDNATEANDDSLSGLCVVLRDEAVGQCYGVTKLP